MTLTIAERQAFSYRALRRDGSFERGVVHAPAREGAQRLLTDRGLLPVELQEVVVGEVTRAALPVAELALGLRLLGDLLEAGLPVGRALHAFEDLAPPGWRPALPFLRDSVREGKSLATALAEAPVEIPPLVTGIVYAGEAGSGIGAAVRRAADVMEQSAATRASIRSALSYPALLALAATGAIALLLGFVLPKFSALLTDLGQSLPRSTRLLLGFADIARASALPAALALTGAIIAWRAWIATAGGRARWHELLRGMPLVGRVRRSTATARAAASLAALLESGVPISHAMLHAARATGDAAAERRLLHAREAITSGEPIGRALDRTGAMTSTAVRLARSGEETGRLAQMLTHAARLERERAELLVRTSVRFIEPALILAFGGLVAFVAAALLQAVYSVRPGA
jgi:general secretion pathway protein F